MRTSAVPVVSLFLWCVLVPARVQCQRPALGRCPGLPTVANFDVEQFKGLWYEVERSFYLFELTSTCTTFNFTENELAPDPSLKVIIKTVSRLTRSQSIRVGTAQPHFTNPARLTFRLRINSYLPTAVSRILPGSGEYAILDTDYTSYAILWSCSDLGFFHADLVWVLGRDKDFPAETRHLIYSTLSNLKFDPDILVITNHTNCPAQY